MTYNIVYDTADKLEEELGHLGSEIKTYDIQNGLDHALNAIANISKWYK